MENDPVIMYVLMRNDLASMTPGRACAQATHAANDCIGFIKDFFKEWKLLDSSILKEWEGETEYFGTTIILGANLDTIQRIYKKLPVISKKEPFLFSGITHDPTYPIKDGQATHLVPVDTCMWLFGRKSTIQPYVYFLDLYRGYDDGRK